MTSFPNNHKIPVIPHCGWYLCPPLPAWGFVWLELVVQRELLSIFFPTQSLSWQIFHTMTCTAFCSKVIIRNPYNEFNTYEKKTFTTSGVPGRRWGSSTCTSCSNFPLVLSKWISHYLYPSLSRQYQVNMFPTEV